MRLILGLSLALGVAAGSSAAEVVYRSVAPDGTVIYSDRPTSADSEPVTVLTPGTTAARPPSPSPSATSSTTNAAPPAADDAVVAAAEPRLSAEERARNCAAARERSERYSTAHRLYRTLPNGEREYLNDAEIDEARARAAAEVETWCS